MTLNALRQNEFPALWPTVVLPFFAGKWRAFLPFEPAIVVLKDTSGRSRNRRKSRCVISEFCEKIGDVLQGEVVYRFGHFKLFLHGGNGTGSGCACFLV